jgi:16S rRNA (guanine527-N7)-methyltransferase
MLVEKYFCDLDSSQIEKLKQLISLYGHLNEKVNLVSRKDIDNLEVHHILHSLAIAKVIDFKENRVLDVGTGGGFPGIPLAIMFPRANFCLVDSTKKKIDAVNDIIKTLKLQNIETKWLRVEALQQEFDFVVCRAVGRLDKVWPLIKDKLITTQSSHNGLYYLKGGNVDSELPKNVTVKIWRLKDFFTDIEYFETKSLILLRPKSYY